MKQFNIYLTEKLKVSARNTTKHTLFPKTKAELKHMIEAEISKNGNECSLNHINVNEINDMSNLFYMSSFNGDISNWDVSSVINMDFMFNNGPLQNNPPKWYKNNK